MFTDLLLNLHGKQSKTTKLWISNGYIHLTSSKQHNQLDYTWCYTINPWNNASKVLPQVGGAAPADPPHPHDLCGGGHGAGLCAREPYSGAGGGRWWVHPCPHILGILVCILLWRRGLLDANSHLVLQNMTLCSLYWTCPHRLEFFFKKSKVL